MEHFCTLFDLGFLPQGLALHASLRRHMPDSVLWILCMDDDARVALERLGLDGVRTLSLQEVETPDLLRVKPGRTRGEYCWTLTSSLMCHVLERDPGLDRLTYVDADTWFLDTPLRLLSALDGTGAHALLTPHDYDPEHDQSATSGRYCVQFVPVRNTPQGRRILEWWRDRCLEWCFARQEPGRFGDQKYLDEWIPLFGRDAAEIPDPSLTMAPWNARRHRDAVGAAVLFHFHNLRIHEGARACLWRGYAVPRAVEETAYRPYLADLGDALRRILASGAVPRLLPPPSPRLPDRWRRWRRSLAGTERWARIPAESGFRTPD